MSDVSDDELGWYVSDVHCRRAIGYLSAALAESGYLRSDFQSPMLLDMWGEALTETMVVTEPSPLGPDQEAVRKFLLATMEARIVRVEERNDRIEEAIMSIARQVI